MTNHQKMWVMIVGAVIVAGAILAAIATLGYGFERSQVTRIQRREEGGAQ